MRQFYTASDIERAAENGVSELTIDIYDVVTDEARDLAKRLGVRIVQAEMISSGVTLAERTSAIGTTLEQRTPPAKAVSSSDVFSEIRRREFPHLKKIHLANCSQGAQPICAAQSIEDFVNNWREEGMDWDYWLKVVVESKATFARLINADPSDVAMSFSVSSAVGTIASSLDYKGIRNRVVTTEIEFPTVPQIWYAHKKFGAQVDMVPVRPDGTVAIEDYEKRLDSKTLILSAPFVYYLNGYKQDLAELARVAHRNGALLMIDAYQGLGTSPIDVKAMDIDFLVSGNLKYLLGVPGIAFTYTKQAIVETLHPASTGWFGQADPFAFDYHLNYAHDGRRLETGTPPALAAFAANASMSLIVEVGVQQIKQRIDELSRYCIERVKTKQLDLVSDFDIEHKAPTTAIRVPNSHNLELELRKRDIVCSSRGDVIRIAHHFYNTEDEIDHTVNRIAELVGRV